MNTLRTVAVALCATLLVTAIFSMLVPSAGMNRFVKLAVRLFFLLCIVTPFFNNQLDFSRNADRYFAKQEIASIDLTTLADQQLLAAFSTNIEVEVAQILESNHVVPEKIRVEAHIDDEKHIDITTIKIELEKDDNPGLGDALSEIKKTIGTAATVVYMGTDAE